MQVKGIKRAAVGVCDGNGKGFAAGASTGIDDGRRGISGDRRADKSCAKGAGFVLNEEKTFIEAEEKIPDFVGFLASLAGPSKLADKPKAYIVGACRRKAKEY